MRHARLAFTVCCLVLASGAPSASAGGLDDPRLADAESWAFAIGGGMLTGDREAVGERLGDFDLAVIDGELATAAEVDELQDRGVAVLGYMSVGTIEKWRGWFDRVKRFRLGAWQDWKDEWFADVSRAKLRRIISRSIAPDLSARALTGSSWTPWT